VDYGERGREEQALESKAKIENTMRPSSGTKPPSSPDPQASDLENIDALFLKAGLVRNRRTGVPSQMSATRRFRLHREDAEDLRRSAPTPRIASNGVEWLALPGRAPSWLWAGFSTRRGGLSHVYCPDDAPSELNLGFTAEDSREAVAGNRRLLVEAITQDVAIPLLTLRQIHSNLVVVAGRRDLSRQLPMKADGLMTDEPNLLLGVQTADCISVLVADRKRRAVAAFHAGWRGTVKRIVEEGVGRMRLQFGSNPEDMVAAIGPGVGACCYAIGEEVLSEFESQFLYARELFHEVDSADVVRIKYPMLFLTQRAPGHSPLGPSLHLDLVEANRRQLLAAGLKPRSIKVIGGCTSCHTGLFFSHRAAHGHAGRMMAVIGIRATN
jgi:YfiH family protein